ncbi:homoserine dehydrogenase [Vescimonas sp.]|uniref:homoserine dehydrogenase n=1 Tax=Vescimonas sp. TaxID=2892404 RepID=UPI00307C24ED
MNIGLLGCGVVGGGILDFCAGREDLTVTKVLVRRPRPDLGALAVTDIADIVSDEAIGIVAEVMGGLHPAYEYICAALKAGKHVVTANKAVISAYYPELTGLARECGVSLRCTAAVGGGIPWLTNLERCKRLDSICELGGIMNGTTNFIMDAMHASPVSFPEILKQAQELGYAEADPSADIDGDDVRRKLTISANIAFDALVQEEDIPMFGIRTVTDGDIRAFKAHGFVCKLLATAKAAEGGVCAFIEPTLVDSHDLEAAVPKNFNLITYCGEKVGRHSFFGQGAGRYPTAFNAVEDCLDIVAGKPGFYTQTMKPAPVLCGGEAHPYYVRTACPDAFLQSVTVEQWGDGVVTACVSVEEMLRWGRAQLAKDPGCFLAGIR